MLDIPEMVHFNPQIDNPPHVILTKEKRVVACRLALLARREVHREAVVARGTRPAEVSFSAGKAQVRFADVADGLEIRGVEIEGFSLSGRDGVFDPAKASVHGDVVTVSCESVPDPAYLRYGFRGFPPCNLFNSVGLPTVPVRTDRVMRRDEAVKVVPVR